MRNVPITLALVLLLVGCSRSGTASDDSSEPATMTPTASATIPVPGATLPEEEPVSTGQVIVTNSGNRDAYCTALNELVAFYVAGNPNPLGYVDLKPLVENAPYELTGQTTLWVSTLDPYLFNEPPFPTETIDTNEPFYGMPAAIQTYAFFECGLDVPIDAGIVQQAEFETRTAYQFEVAAAVTAYNLGGPTATPRQTRIVTQAAAQNPTLTVTPASDLTTTGRVTVTSGELQACVHLRRTANELPGGITTGPCRPA